MLVVKPMVMVYELKINKTNGEQIIQKQKTCLSRSYLDVLQLQMVKLLAPKGFQKVCKTFQKVGRKLPLSGESFHTQRNRPETGGKRVGGGEIWKLGNLKIRK